MLAIDAYTRFEKLEQMIELLAEGNTENFDAIDPDDVVAVVKLLQREYKISNALYEALGPANDDIMEDIIKEVGVEV